MSKSDYWDSITMGLVLPNLAIDLRNIEGIEVKLAEGGDKIIVRVPLPNNSNPAELRIDGRSRSGVLRKPSPHHYLDRATLQKMDETMRDYGFVAYQFGFTEHPFNQEDLWR